MNEHEIDHDCPYCSAHLECATGLDQNKLKPDAGSFTICIVCGGLSQFNAEMKLIEPTLDDLIKVQTLAPKVWQQINLAQKLIKARISSGFKLPSERKHEPT